MFVLWIRSLCRSSVLGWIRLRFREMKMMSHTKPLRHVSSRRFRSTSHQPPTINHGISSRRQVTLHEQVTDTDAYMRSLSSSRLLSALGSWSFHVSCRKTHAPWSDSCSNCSSCMPSSCHAKEAKQAIHPTSRGEITPWIRVSL